MNIIKRIIVRVITNPHHIKYHNGWEYSGIFWKFIPYTPARNERGINIAENMVSTFMTSFILLLTFDRYKSSIPDVRSRKVSTVSIIWIVWSYTSRRYMNVLSCMIAFSVCCKVDITSRSGHIDFLRKINSCLRA